MTSNTFIIILLCTAVCTYASAELAEEKVSAVARTISNFLMIGFLVCAAVGSSIVIDRLVQSRNQHSTILTLAENFR